MKTDHAGEAAREIMARFVCETPVDEWNGQEITRIIQVAIEKATNGLLENAPASNAAPKVQSSGAAEKWHPCEHCKQFNGLVEILDQKSYSVGEAKNWDSAVSLCDAHNATLQQSDDKELKWLRAIHGGTLKELIQSQSDDTKRLLSALRAVRPFVENSITVSTKDWRGREETREMILKEIDEAIDAAMKRKEV